MSNLSSLVDTADAGTGTAQPDSLDADIAKFNAEIDARMTPDPEVPPRPAETEKDAKADGADEKDKVSTDYDHRIQEVEVQDGDPNDLAMRLQRNEAKLDELIAAQRAAARAPAAETAPDPAPSGDKPVFQQGKGNENETFKKFNERLADWRKGGGDKPAAETQQPKDPAPETQQPKITSRFYNPDVLDRMVRAMRDSDKLTTEEWGEVVRSRRVDVDMFPAIIQTPHPERTLMEIARNADLSADLYEKWEADDLESMMVVIAQTGVKVAAKVKAEAAAKSAAKEQNPRDTGGKERISSEFPPDTMPETRASAAASAQKADRDKTLNDLIDDSIAHYASRGNAIARMVD